MHQTDDETDPLGTAKKAGEFEESEVRNERLSPFLPPRQPSHDT